MFIENVKCNHIVLMMSQIMYLLLQILSWANNSLYNCLVFHLRKAWFRDTSRYLDFIDFTRYIFSESLSLYSYTNYNELLYQRIKSVSKFCVRDRYRYFYMKRMDLNKVKTKYVVLLAIFSSSSSIDDYPYNFSKFRMA